MNRKIELHTIAQPTTVSGDGLMYTYNDGEFEVSVRFAKNGWDRKENQKMRVYVYGEDEVDFAPAYKLSEDAGSMRRGASEAADKMFDKLNRQVVKNKRQIVTEAAEKMPVVAALIDQKINFSKKAGCSSCPCSPGFISSVFVDDKTENSGIRNIVSVWITRSTEAAAAE